jgi:hypothetical protein
VGGELIQPLQFPSRSSYLAFLVNLTARIFHAIADHFLVNIQPDLMHVSFVVVV